VFQDLQLGSKFTLERSSSPALFIGQHDQAGCLLEVVGIGEFHQAIS
tara:strand:+ start:301 stop:441 length:141 start_codon:yes stop_codon:yes gene_type:complete